MVDIAELRITLNTSLEDAKQFLRENYKTGGAICPCCKQMVKQYNRKVSSSQMYGLINLVRLYLQDYEYKHVTDIGVSTTGGEFAQLRRWGLIQDARNDDEAKRTSGMWMPTRKGVAFAKNEIKIPMYCYTYNNETKGFSEEMTSIIQAINNKFNYKELMNGEIA